MTNRYKYLTNEQYQRLCECRSRKEDIPALARCYMKDENAAPEDALVSALELLDSNNQYIDLTQEEYDAVIAEIKGLFENKNRPL